MDQEARLKKTIQQSDKMPERREKVHQEKKIVLRVSKKKKKETAVLIESVDHWHPPHCRYLKKAKMSNGRGLSIHTLTKEESVYQSKRKR